MSHVNISQNLAQASGCKGNRSSRPTIAFNFDSRTLKVTKTFLLPTTIFFDRKNARIRLHQIPQLMHFKYAGKSFSPLFTNAASRATVITGQIINSRFCLYVWHSAELIKAASVLLSVLGSAEFKAFLISNVINSGIVMSQWSCYDVLRISAHCITGIVQYTNETKYFARNFYFN